MMAKLVILREFVTLTSKPLLPQRRLFYALHLMWRNYNVWPLGRIDYSLFWHLSGGTISQTMLEQQNHCPSLPKKTHDSFVPHLDPAQHSSLRPFRPPTLPKKMVCTCIVRNIAIYALKESILRWGLDTCFYISFTPLTLICLVFSLVTNVLIVSHFGQKCLLNALNVNVNVNKVRGVQAVLYSSC